MGQRVRGTRITHATTIGNRQPALPSGIGPLNDGDYWRRLRLVMEGTFWETFEYRWNYRLGKHPVRHGWAR